MTERATRRFVSARAPRMGGPCRGWISVGHYTGGADWEDNAIVGNRVTIHFQKRCREGDGLQRRGDVATRKSDSAHRFPPFSLIALQIAVRDDGHVASRTQSCSFNAMWLIDVLNTIADAPSERARPLWGISCVCASYCRHLIAFHESASPCRRGASTPKTCRTSEHAKQIAAAWVQRRADCDTTHFASS